MRSGWPKSVILHYLSFPTHISLHRMQPPQDMDSTWLYFLYIYMLAVSYGLQWRILVLVKNKMKYR
jgi:hypothetical protein